jgi:hypothetical protein
MRRRDFIVGVGNAIVWPLAGRAQTPLVRMPRIGLMADVAGYSRLIGLDEEGTHVQLREHLSSVINPRIAERRGRVVKYTGDGLLAEFGSAVDAVRCAIDFRRWGQYCGSPRRDRHTGRHLHLRGCLSPGSGKNLGRSAAASNALAGRMGVARQALERLRKVSPAMRVSNLEEFVVFRRREDITRYLEGLRLAGLPE